MPLARAVTSLHTPPEQRHGVCGDGSHRAGNRHRKVKARGRQVAMVGVVKIVQHIDAAAKHSVLVHHAQLAVQASPPVWHQQAQARAQGRINTPLNPGFFKAAFPFWRKSCSADAINQHLYVDAACGSAG